MQNLPTFHYIGAAWCGPCRDLKPFIKETYPSVVIHDADISKFAQSLNIKSVPALAYTLPGWSGRHDLVYGATAIRTLLRDLFEDSTYASL